MKKTLLFLLIFLVVFTSLSLYWVDKEYFICPIQYKRDMIIRCDSRGNGFFAAQRNGNRLHEGLDFLAGVGTPVLAARSGIVIAAAHNRGMGAYVIIQHGENIRTIYGHLSRIYVANNEFVRQGEVIGAVGKTGNANLKDIQAHLHFEVKKNRIPQDPLQYLE